MIINLKYYPMIAIAMLFISSVLLVTCKKNNSNLSFSDENTKNVILLSNGKIYSNDKLFLGYPMRMEFHPDSFLIIQDFNTEKLIKIIDLKNNNILELIPKGRGPGEILISWGLKVIDRDIFVFDGQLCKVIRLIPDANRGFVIGDEFEIEEKHSIEFYPINFENFVCLSVTSIERHLRFRRKYHKQDSRAPRHNTKRD